MFLRKTLILISSLILCLQSWGATKLSKDLCLPIIKDFEAVSNASPDEVEAKAPDVLAQLKDGERLTYYFIAYNIYVENLFNQGKIEKAGKELDAMVNEAASQDDPECQTIALRTQGQFYYKLGLYDRAQESFMKALKICPSYDSGQLDSYFTWSSTLFWLVHSQLQLGDVDSAEAFLSKMDKMMLWLEQQGIKDEIGYKPVMILGLKARIAIQRGDNALASSLLNSCLEFIKPDIPERAYIEYHVGKMMLAVSEGRYNEALPLLDNLIDIHIDQYKPIAATFLNQKANLLYELGRYQESADAFKQYEELQSQVYDISIAHQLDEVTTRYKVGMLQQERERMRDNLFFAIVICLALIVIVVIVAISRKRHKQKNVVLAQNISKLHRLLRQNGETSVSVISIPDPLTDEDHDKVPNPEYVAIGNKIVDYIKTSKCYLSPNCGRQTIKDGIGVSEQLLSKSLPLVTGMTFVNYINRLRLDHAIYLIEKHPEITINKISTMCGFGTLRHFQRIFKQQYDLTPSAYREARDASGDPSKSTLQDAPEDIQPTDDDKAE